MFKQFIDKVSGADFYLITSLWIFIAFFLLVGLFLLKMKNEYVSTMKNMPLSD